MGDAYFLNAKQINMVELDILKREVFDGRTQQMQTKYRLIIPRYEIWDMESVSKLISERTTLAAGEVEFVLRVLEDVLVEALEYGAGMELGALGKVEPSLSAAAVDSKEEISLKNVRKVNLIYKPSKRIKKALKELKFTINRRSPRSSGNDAALSCEE